MTSPAPSRCRKRQLSEQTDKKKTISGLSIDHDFLQWDLLRERLQANETTLRYEQREGSSVLRVTDESSSSSSSSSQASSTIRLIHIPCAFGLSRKGNPLSSLLTSAKAAMMAAYDFNHRRSEIVPNLPQLLTPRTRPSTSSGNNDNNDNNNPEQSSSTPCNLHLTLDFYDTERSVIRGATILTEHVHPRPFPYQATAMVGAVRSAVSMPMATLNSLVGLPQISYASTSSDLNNRDSYPLFGRVVPSTDGDAAAALDYFVNVLGTTHLGILYIKDTYGSTYHLSLDSAANQRGVRTKSVAIDSSAEAPDFENKMMSVLATLQQTGYRHFMAIIGQTHLGTLVRSGRKLGIVGPGNFWLFGDGINARGLGSVFATSEDPLGFHGFGFLSLGSPIEETQTEKFMKQYLEFDSNKEFLEYYAYKTVRCQQ